MVRWLGFLTLAAIAAGQTLTLTFDRPEIFDHDSRFWSGPFLLGLDKNSSSSPIICTLDRYGNKEDIPFPIAGAASVFITGLAASEGGTIIVAGRAADQHAVRFGFVATIPKDRSMPGIVKDEPFYPHLAAVASDGVVWVIGDQVDKDNSAKQPNVLKRFSPSGKLLTNSVIKATTTLRDLAQCNMRAVKDRVGLFDGSSYTEFSLDGTVIGRFPVPPGDRRYFPAFALNDNLQAVVQSSEPPRPIWVLDRMKAVWNRLEADEVFTTLLGFDGPQLVLEHFTGNRGTVLAHYLLNSDPY